MLQLRVWAVGLSLSLAACVVGQSKPIADRGRADQRATDGARETPAADARPLADADGDIARPGDGPAPRDGPAPDVPARDGSTLDVSSPDGPSADGPAADLAPTADSSVDSTSPVRSWKSLTTPTTDDLYTVWGSSNANVYAGGGTLTAGTLLRFDGAQVSTVSYSGGTVWGIWGSAANNVYAVASSALRRFNGSGWSTVTIPGSLANLRNVGGSSTSNVYLLGRAGELAHDSGSGFAVEASGTSTDLYAVYSSGSGDGYIVGASGLILRRSGGSWQPMTSNTTQTLSAVAGSGSLVIAVGAGATMLRLNGSSWQPFTPAPPVGGFFKAIWVGSANDLVLTTFSGGVWRYDGSWTSASAPSGQLEDLYRAPNSDLFVVGRGGLMLHYGFH